MTTPDPEAGTPVDTKCGFVAIIGATNAGKSTLVNALVGAKVTIVSHKVQTTRAPIRGIAISGLSQLVFIDTPGIFRPRRRLDRAMVDAAWSGAGEADIVALIVDASRGLEESVEAIVGRLADISLPRILILNKVDRVANKAALLDLTTKLSSRVPFEQVFMISALNSDGVDDLKAWLDTLPE